MFSAVSVPISVCYLLCASQETFAFNFEPHCSVQGLMELLHGQCKYSDLQADQLKCFSSLPEHLPHPQLTYMFIYSSHMEDSVVINTSKCPVGISQDLLYISVSKGRIRLKGLYIILLAIGKA